MKIQVEFEEKGTIFFDVLEVGKDCTQEQAKVMLSDGHATILKEEVKS